jgi:hypothetical protein
MVRVCVNSKDKLANYEIQDLVMTKKPSAPWQPVNPETLAKQFSKLGWMGFWLQFVLLAITVFLLFYVLFLSSPDSAQSKGIDLGNYLSYGSLVVLVFTTLWFLRYTRVGNRIADPATRPPQASVLKTLWIGLWACSLGVFFSMLLLFSAVGRLLFVLLSNPQTGIQLAPGPGGDPLMSLSAIDAVSMTSLLVVLSAELIVLGLTLWLLFRASRTSTKDAKAPA